MNEITFVETSNIYECLSEDDGEEETEIDVSIFYWNMTK